MSNVHYIPIGVTDIQYDLIEILISMHYNSLIDEIYKGKLIKNDTTNDMIDNHKKCLSSRQMIYLLDSHIRAVLNHPCLLVDHFMPRKFLQMETINNLTLSSDKFKVLQKILFQLVDNFNKDVTNLNILIIAHNVKELDLLEGLLLGQFFKLKRLSGNSLYDEKHLLDFHNNTTKNITTADNISSSSSNNDNHKNSNNNTSSRAKRRKIHSNDSFNNINDSNSTKQSSSSNKSKSKKNSDRNNINGTLHQSNYNSNNKNIHDFTNAPTINNSSNNDTVTNDFKESSIHISSSESSINNNNTNNSGSNTNNNNNNNNNYSNYTGYSKDDYDYSNRYFKKIWKKNDSLDNRNWLFLTTTNHLIHNENLLKKYNINLFIAFDPLLNTDIPAIKNSNDSTTNQKKNSIPIIKLLVKDSPDHYIIEKNLLNQIDTTMEYENIKKSLDHFLQNRSKMNHSNNNNNTDNNNVNNSTHNSNNSSNTSLNSLKNETTNNKLDFKKLLNDIIFPKDTTIENETKKNTNILPLTECSNNNDSNFLLPRFKCGNLVGINGNDYDWKGYQLDLMQKTIARLNFLKDKFKYNKENSFIKRLAETKRQNEIDSLKEEIGKNFKELQELDKAKIDADKKFNSISMENDKLKFKKDKLLNKIKLIEQIILDSEKENDVELFIDSKIKEYETNKETLNVQINEYTKLNELQDKENDELRNKYQIDSNEAMNKSLQLNALKKNKETLIKEKDGPLPTELNLNSLNSTSRQLSLRLEQLQNDNKFLSEYIKKNNENTSGAKTLKNSSSSRFRSTRSVTPNYT